MINKATRRSILRWIHPPARKSSNGVLSPRPETRTARRNQLWRAVFGGRGAKFKTIAPGASPFTETPANVEICPTRLRVFRLPLVVHASTRRAWSAAPWAIRKRVRTAPGWSSSPDPVSGRLSFSAQPFCRAQSRWSPHWAVTRRDFMAPPQAIS